MIGLLIKNRLNAVFGSFVSRSGRKKEIKKAGNAKIFLLILLYLFVAVVFLGLSVSVSLLLSTALLPGADWLYYLVFMTLTLMLVFILSIFETKTELFECKDNDLLLSMPIKPRDIVAARIFVVLIYNYIISGIILLPAIVCYAIATGAVEGTVGGILVFLFLPLLATALSTGVGYLVAELSRRMKNKNIITIVLSFAFVLLYFWFYSTAMENIEAVLATLMGMSAELAENYKILYYIGSSALLSPIPTLIMALVCLISAAVAYYIISSRYIKIVTDVRGAKKAVYREKRLKTKSALYAFTVKDIRHFFSSPIYVLNGGMGLLMSLLLGVFAVIKGDFITLLTVDLGLTREAVASCAIALLMLLLSTTIISACSLSVEGKNLWIIKTMPIDARTVLLSKALMQFVISFPTTLVASVLLIIATAPSPALWAVYIIAPQLASLLFSLFGILINVAFPKFNYENEAQAVKQSLATLICMMGSMLFSTALLIGTFFVSVYSAPLGILLLIGAPAVLISIEILLLIYPASKRYESLVL